MDKAEKAWREFREFLNSNPSPEDSRRLEYGEARYSMGMHRFFLQKKVDGRHAVPRIVEIAEKHGLKLDVREEPRDDKFNIVVWMGDEYVGRLDHTRLILMPQRISKELFADFLRIYVGEKLE